MVTLSVTHEIVMHVSSFAKMSAFHCCLWDLYSEVISKSRLKDQTGKYKAGWVLFERHLVTLLLKKSRQRCVSIFALLMRFHLDVVLCQESPI